MIFFLPKGLVVCGLGDYLILELMTYRLNPAKKKRWSHDYGFFSFKESIPTRTAAYLERDHAPCYLVSMPKKVSSGEI